VEHRTFSGKKSCVLRCSQGVETERVQRSMRKPVTFEQERAMAKGKDKPSKQTKKPKSDKPKGTGSAYQQDKTSGKKG
jgi:hypothetical protein